MEKLLKEELSKLPKEYRSLIRNNFCSVGPLLIEIREDLGAYIIHNNGMVSYADKIWHEEERLMGSYKNVATFTLPYRPNYNNEVEISYPSVPLDIITARYAYITSEVNADRRTMAMALVDAFQQLWLLGQIPQAFIDNVSLIETNIITGMVEDIEEFYGEFSRFDGYVSYVESFIVSCMNGFPDYKESTATKEDLKKVINSRLERLQEELGGKSYKQLERNQQVARAFLSHVDSVDWESSDYWHWATKKDLLPSLLDIVKGVQPQNFEEKLKGALTDG